jgi:hypothetical protein
MARCATIRWDLLDALCFFLAARLFGVASHAFLTIKTGEILWPLGLVRLVAGNASQRLGLLIARALAKLIDMTHNRHPFIAIRESVMNPVVRQRQARTIVANLAAAELNCRRAAEVTYRAE